MGFFANKAMAGVLGANEVDDELLTVAVEVGDDVISGLEFGFCVSEMLFGMVSSAAGGFLSQCL